MDERLLVSGIHEETGLPLGEDLTSDRAVELALETKAELFTPSQQKVIEAIERQKNPERHMGPMAHVDEKDLSQTGWGVIFASGDPDEERIRSALGELLELRERQAGARYKPYSGKKGYKPEYRHAEDWLSKRDGSAFDPVDPENVPYYLLIVGSPEKIPYRFQYELGMQYAVGRIDFGSRFEDYEAYAKAVVAAETGPNRRAKRVTMWAPVNGGRDLATRMSASELVEPLGKHFGSQFPAWQVESLVGGDSQDASATKANLMKRLRDSAQDRRPALLFTASHGLAVDEFERKRNRQGALVGQEWPGKGPVDPAWYFHGDDVTPELETDGLISFHFACYSGGTPLRDNFGGKRELADFTAGEELDRRISEEPFVAKLPQRLLANGALAVVGHVERAFPQSFCWKRKRQIGTFRDALTRLAEGYPVGHAMDEFGRRYTTLVARLFPALIGDPEPDLVAELWTATTDARNYVIVGDPAVRLNV